MKNINTNGLPLRTGLFGGTFDPIHIGHLKIAMDVRVRFSLDRIYFIPSAMPPHKTNEALAPAADRYEMVRLALGDDRALVASDVETARGGCSYSCDTVSHFKGRMSDDGRLYFLVGVDAFMEIHTWKNYARLFDQVRFIVMTRPPWRDSFEAFAKSLESYVQQKISPHYALSKESATLIHNSKKPICFTAVTPVEIASTRIRRMIRMNQPIDTWVAPAVADYIRRRGLYR